MQYVLKAILLLLFSISISNCYRLCFSRFSLGSLRPKNAPIDSFIARKRPSFSVIQESFEDEESFNCPLLVTFYAPWCGPSRMMEKVLVEIGNTFGNHMKVARVNVEAEEERAATFEIQALPTLFVLYDNLIVDRMIGYRDSDTLTKELLNSLKKIEMYRASKQYPNEIETAKEL